MLLRMLNDPCQSETGRQMARANPKFIRCYAKSQEPGAALARAVKSSTALAEIILFDSRATRGNVAAFGSSPPPPERLDNGPDIQQPGLQLVTSLLTPFGLTGRDLRLSRHGRETP
jgi:hypothetical protein